MKRVIWVFLGLVLVGGWPSVALAERNAYVSDELTIAIRSGTTLQHRILRFVRSGTPVTILETDGDYVRIRIPDGIEGWTEAQHLVNTPHARVRLEQTQRRLEQLTEQRGDVERALREARTEREQEAQTAQALAQRVQTLEAELASLRQTAARPLELTRENQALQEALERERAIVNRLSEENDALRDKTIRDWFLAGGGVAMGSLLLGLLLSRVSIRRKRYTGTW
ncbi:TIGR04211 family SH3 domain-containing protein [Thiorhodospira sibirica]|uniref:TIGR04211 family SH3 domain-containing protein n=1 Tax=Thiorhodospira sibirica TaxID=154347 RepID=UPI00022C04D7|nr:TIGR04211 family SH3 domain-containing protein [Thiorhodospira sibirica]